MKMYTLCVCVFQGSETGDRRSVMRSRIFVREMDEAKRVAEEMKSLLSYCSTQIEVRTRLGYIPIYRLGDFLSELKEIEDEINSSVKSIKLGNKTKVVKMNPQAFTVKGE